MLVEWVKDQLKQLKRPVISYMIPNDSFLRLNKWTKQKAFTFSSSSHICDIGGSKMHTAYKCYHHHFRVKWINKTKCIDFIALTNYPIILVRISILSGCRRNDWNFYCCSRYTHINNRVEITNDDLSCRCQPADMIFGVQIATAISVPSCISLFRELHNPVKSFHFDQ